MSTSLDKIYNILHSIEEFEDYTTADNVRDRLDKCLDLYLGDLDYSYYHLVDNINKKSVMRGLSKCE